MRNKNLVQPKGVMNNKPQGLTHNHNELVIRNVLKQAKTVAEYHDMAKRSEDRMKELNPFN
jgi:hypothetical protein